jgi:predicted nucleic acid-binding protein
VLVDTSVWSLALWRRRQQLSAEERGLVDELVNLISEGLVVMVGSVRQELLSGLRDGRTFERLRDHLRAFPDEPLLSGDFEDAARAFNTCRRRGISGSAIDLLLCAVAMRRELALLTTDPDFERHAQHLPLTLYKAKKS